MGTPGNPADALANLESLTDDQLDELADKLGLTDDGDEDSSDHGTDDGTPADESAQGLDGGSEPGASPGTGTEQQQTPPLTGQALLDALGKDTTAQKLVQDQINNWLAQASASADAKKEQEEFQKLVESGDFEAIGRRYVQAESEKGIRSKAEEEALTREYQQVYSKLFKEIETLGELSDTDKVRLDHNQYGSDAEYVLALSNFIAEKRQSGSLDDLVKKGVEQKLEALRNMKSADRANGFAPSNIPAGRPANGNEKQDSRSLIQEGFAEFLEGRQEQRVGLGE